MLVKNSDEYETVLFYDGECGLCDASVQRVIEKDHLQIFRYAALQGSYAAKHLASEFISDPSTVVVVHQGETLIRSTAFIKILELLDQYLLLRIGLKCTPRVIRDLGYRIVAKNRHRFKKKKNSCQLIAPELRKKLFLD